PLYDYVSSFFFAGQWCVWQRAALNFVQGSDLLEVGYGTGALALELCRRGYSPVGIDLSPRMHLIATRKLRHRGCSARLCVGSSTGLPFASDSFDTVFSTFPSAYIMHPRTWEEVHRVLRLGGRFVIVLSGELLPVDHRSKLLIRFHRFVYGNPADASLPCWSAIPGFDLTTHVHRTAQGVAHILLAEKRSTSLPQ
ncbi:MAG: class I SAM-dependent methyltransferase, partial [Chloroflexota bacterium]|nr:class I SAM-dependent methyltransferase [Chloroflexota bacterium]